MDPRRASQHAATLRAGRWFRGLEEPFQRDLLAAAQERSLREGERLFSRGDPCDGLYAVVSGSVRVLGVSAAGREVVLTLVEPPGWFGEIAVFDGAARTHDAVAQLESTLVHLPQRALEAMLAAHPERWRALALLLTAKLRVLFEAMEELSSLPVEQRLARRLLLLAQAHGEAPELAQRKVSARQEQLAAMLGTSRQTVNALLKQFEAQGLLRVAYGQLELRDFEGLRRVAEGPK